MAGFINQSGVNIYLPDGSRIEAGHTVDLDATTVAIAGVAQIIDAGKLVAQDVRRGRPTKGAGNGTIDAGDDTIVAD